MAKPRIFVSSTYYDLKHIRQSIETFIAEMGYESVLFESGDIPFDHQASLDDSCYKEMGSCQILVLVIGGRYGSASSDETVKISKDELEKHYQHFNSVTKQEYEAARDKDIPIYIFVEKVVAAEYQTYQKNKESKSVKYAHVDSVNIFRLLDSIYSQGRNNFVREFENVKDITDWLREQWAGLFAKFLGEKSSKKSMESMEKQLANLNSVAESLEEYSKKIIQGVSPEKSEEIIQNIKEDEQSRINFNLFIDSPSIRVLVSGFEVSEEQLYPIFVDTKNFPSFLEAAAKFDHGILEWLYQDDFFYKELQNGLILLRDELKLTPWKPVSKPKKP